MALSLHVRHACEGWHLEGTNGKSKMMLKVVDSSVWIEAVVNRPIPCFGWTFLKQNLHSRHPASLDMWDVAIVVRSRLEWLHSASARKNVLNCTCSRPYSYSASLVRILSTNPMRIFYGEYYGKSNAYANSAYQALSPPPQRTWGRGYVHTCNNWLPSWIFFLLSVAVAWINNSYLGVGKVLRYNFIQNIEKNETRV